MTHAKEALGFDRCSDHRRGLSFIHGHGLFGKYVKAPAQSTAGQLRMCPRWRTDCHNIKVLGQEFLLIGKPSWNSPPLSSGLRLFRLPVQYSDHVDVRMAPKCRHMT